MLTTCYYGVPLYERLVDIELLIVRVPAYYQKVLARHTEKGALFCLLLFFGFALLVPSRSKGLG